MCRGTAIGKHHIACSTHHEHLLAHHGNGCIAIGAIVGAALARALGYGLCLAPCLAVVVARADYEVNTRSCRAIVVTAYVVETVAIVAHGNESARRGLAYGWDAV